MMGKAISTDINFCLDRSRSMLEIRKETIRGFNGFLLEQKALPGKAWVSLFQFDHVFEPVYQSVPIDHAAQLTEQTFVPRGSTALRDAIARTILAVEARKPTAESVLIVISTDGYENASVDFGIDAVRMMIEAKTKLGWTFLYLGANQDAVLTASQYGIARGQTMSVAANDIGTQSAYNTVSETVMNVRARGASAAQFTEADRLKQKEAGAHSD